MNKKNALTKYIVAHSYNADKSEVAIAPNSPDLLIYKTNGAPEAPSKWTLLHTLSEHHLIIVGVDWCHKTNQIVTAGQDRNAYVWTQTKDTWKPDLVILRINRAATSVRWTASGAKFAVGAGSKDVPICRYEPTQNFWVAKTIKKHKSTILCLDWHPNSAFLITGAADFRTRIFSAYMKKVDNSDQLNDFEAIFSKKSMTKFGELLMDFPSGGWVEAVSWSPSMLDLAYAGHDSTMNFVNLKSKGVVQTIKLDKLPLRTIGFLSEKACVAAGYDKVPYLFTFEEDAWVLKGPLDTGKTKKATGKKNAFGDARKMFANKGIKKGASSTTLNSKHQNIISEIRAWDETTFSTSGMDGCIFFWDINKEY